jgi:hypothetical protein
MESIIEKINKEIAGSYTVTIESDAIVHVDDYENGEGEYRNSFDNRDMEFNSSPETLVEDIKTNLQKYIKNEICTSYDETSLKEQMADEDEDHFWVSVFVDVDNTEPNESQIERWKKGEEELFVQDNDVRISINGTPLKNGILTNILFDEVTA